MIMKAGHGGNSGRFQRMQETAEVRARFIMSQY
jgi:protease II